MVSLATPVERLRGIGPSTASKLIRLGIKTAADLLSHFPIRHQDLRQITPIAALRTDVTSVIRGKLQLIKSRRSFRRRISLTEALVKDDSGTVRVVWFNQPYLTKSYQPGDEVWLVGKLTLSAYGPQFQSPLIEPVRPRQLLAGRILPVYRATAGLSQRQIRFFIEAALPAADRIPDWLPTPLRTRERLIDLKSAIRSIHFPLSQPRLDSARERLKFGELFLFSLSVIQAERLRQQQPAPTIPFNQPATRAFVRSLPFRLTDDQRRAAWEILQDLVQPRPMNRLLEGDVGAGKTVVAAIAMQNAAVHGIQSAMLAPTDILARQHYQTLKRFFAERLRIALLTRTQREWTKGGLLTKAALLKSLATGEIDAIIGTHALLSENVIFANLGFTIIDEQHRFGVEQRHLLQTKRRDRTPHFLSMTATPIPRSLALTLYGDLQLSFLKQLPPGRTPVTTQVVSSADEQRVFEHILNRAAADQQTYVVCPLIEESDELGVAAATSQYQRLKDGPLQTLSLGLLHGKLAAQAKHRSLADFAAGKTQVLVATPVVEVGVDVPNATTMVILGAERFGLAQLHQLRGRVGRSAKPSACFLITDSDDPDVHQRLAIVEQTTDGFALAEEDLRRRGPGDVYGLRQSGLPQFTMASLTDLELMKRAQTLARGLLAQDVNLSAYPLLQRKTQAFFKTIHPE